MKLVNWILFVVLSVIWGSSFILMKYGLAALNPYQVAAIRILSAGIVLLPFAARSLWAIPRAKFFVIMLTGLSGSFFPAYLFCIAETKIDSSLAGIFNALTPLFTILIGVLFFNLDATRRKRIGVAVGFAGLLLLFIKNGRPDAKNASYSLLVLAATIMYGINVNLVGRYLKDIGAFKIAAIAFSFLTIPSVVILFFTGYFSMHLTDGPILMSTAASALLGIMGTAVATVLFYMLLKRAGALFASMVTYGIPIVAVLWGLFYGETISFLQIASLVIILWGVYIANTRKKR